MGSGEGSGGRPHLIGRLLVFAVNFILWLSGILLVVFGALALADEDIIVNLLNAIDGVEYLTPIFDVVKLLEGVAIFMIVLGCFLFLLGGNGCHGIVGKSKKSIMIYNVLLVCAILVEIGLIVYCFVYPDSKDTSIQEELNSTFVNYDRVGVDSTTGDITYATDPAFEDEAWQKLQIESGCCGVYNYTDYQRNGMGTYQYTYPVGITRDSVIPLTCCVITNNNLDGLPTKITDFDYNDCLNLTLGGLIEGSYNTEGCWKTVDDMHSNFNLIAVILSGCLMLVELLGVLVASYVWKKTGSD